MSRTATVCVLVDKEFVAFGHKCGQRLGVDGTAPWSGHEWSPILLQFLDAVHQLVRQQPAAFEFTDALLVSIATHMHAANFGTFRSLCDRERRAQHSAACAAAIAADDDAPPVAGSASLWEWVAERSSLFAHSAYAEWPLSRGPLRGTCAMQHMALWRFYLVRTGELGYQTLGDEYGFLGAADEGVEGLGGDKGGPGERGADGARLMATCGKLTTEVSAGGTRYTLYHFELRGEGDKGEVDEEDDGDDEGEGAPASRTLTRRFLDFVELDGRLRRSLARDLLRRLPALPSKWTLNKFGASVLATRTTALVAYLHVLVSSAELRQHPMVVTFLSE
jgi:hypothetical protein